MIPALRQWSGTSIVSHSRLRDYINNQFTVLTSSREKQRELADCESSHELAAKELQAVEAALSEIKNQLRQKSEQVRSECSHDACTTS